VERPVKERLVGAAVLMAAAIVLIPEMLSGPERTRSGSEPSLQDAERSEGAIKTYTIDLSQAPGASAAAATMNGADNRVPPSEEVAPPLATSPAAAPPPEVTPSEPTASEPTPSESHQASPESVTVTPAVVPAQSAPDPSDSSPIVAEAPLPQTSAPAARTEAPPAKVDTPPTRPVASAPIVPTSPTRTARGWAVQLGSYSSEATAERLVNEWRGKGQDAFVMPVKSGGKTLFRVRIGPTKDRAASEAALKAVKASVPGAAIVAHP
jgi:DedD protein